MKKVKRLCSFMLVFCLLLTLAPQTMILAEDAGWINIEGESGSYTSQYVSIITQDAASDKKALKVFTKSEDVDVDYEFNVASAGKYDVWVLGVELSSAPITFSINGGSALDFVTEGDNLYTEYFGSSADGAGIGWTGKATWYKIAGNVELAANANTIKATFKTNRGNQERVGVVDAIRIVPTDWGWVAEANLNEPVAPEVPEEPDTPAIESTWINIEAESGDYPEIYRKAANENTSGGEYIEVSGDNYNAETDATVDWSFDVENAGKYDVYALMSTFAASTSVSQPAWGLDEEASTANAGVAVSDPVYNFAYTDTFGGGYTRNFVWVKVFSGKELTADTHTLQYIAQLGTGNFTTRLLAGLDVIRVVPSDWGWIPEANLDAPKKADPKPFDVEVETGTLTELNGSSGASAVLGDSATGRNYMIANGSHAGLKSTKTFTCPVSGDYDIWAVVGVGADAKYLGGYTFTMDSENAFYSEYMSTATAKAIGDSLYTSSQLTSGLYHREMKWVKIATAKEISVGEHTLISQVTKAEVNDNMFGTIDVVRFVPADYMWIPDSGFAEATPTEWVQVEAEDGVLSDKCVILNQAAASGGKFVSFQSNKASSADEVQTITMQVKVAKTGIYDMWIIAGRGNTNSVVEWTFTLDGKTYTQPESPSSYTLYANGGLGWGQEMFWHRSGTGIELEAGKEYTLVASTKSARSDLAFLQGLDVVRFVPTDWYWGGTDNVNPPKKSIISADRDGMVTIEPEKGIITSMSAREHTKASGGRYVAALSSSNGGSSLSAFDVAKSGKYDIWAAVATIPGDANYIGGYTFTMDDTDVIYSKGLATVDKTNPDLYGETFVLHSGAVDASTGTVRWVKLADEKAITSGVHTLLSATSNPVYSDNNKCGLIDCVYIVPSEWEWIASDSFLVDKGFLLRDESFAWVEGEDFIPANTDAESVSIGVAGGTPSGGKELYRNARGSADANFAPSFTFDVFVDKAGAYQLWNYGYMYSGDSGMHFGKMTASANGGSTDGTSDYQTRTTEPGTDGQVKQWNRLKGALNLVEGKNTITVTYTFGGIHNLFCTDAVAVLPAEWDWTPEAINANDTAPKLDVLSAYKAIVAQTGISVANDLVLPDRGATGSIISYVSTNPAISNTGKVTIPTGWAGGDSKGTITATATKGGLSATSESVNTVVYAVKPIEYDAITFEGDFSAGSNVTAKITGVKSTTSEEGNTAVGVVAVYNDGALSSINISDEKTITTTAQNITATASLPAEMKNILVKGFLWTGLNNSIIPISETVAYSTEGAGHDADMIPALKAKYDAKNISGFNLGIIADVQSPALSGYQAYSHHYNSLAKASELIELDAVADLGDMIMGTSSDKAGTLALLSEQTEILAKTNAPVFRIMGNHDDNRWAAVNNKDGSLAISNAEWTEACSADWANVMDGTTAGVEPYYYKDFADDKIRIIALNGVDIPYEYKGETSVGYTFGFTEAQLDWLANEALDFSDKADKDEWGVIILTHVLSYDYDNTVINFAGFGNIMQAFMAGTSGTYSNTNEKAPVNNLAYDFTEQGEMEVICMFNGHTHIDGDGEMWGMKYITIGSSLPDENDSPLNRDLYTKNEDLWDIMTIDRANRKIYATRFGAGEDREFTY